MFAKWYVWKGIGIAELEICMNIYSLKNSLFQPYKSTEFHLSLSLTRKCQTKPFEMSVKTYVIRIEWLDMQFK